MDSSPTVLSMIKAKDISKSYKKTLALDHVSIDVGKKEIFGLIGPDGAGKTSLIRILATLILPDSGNGEVDGYNILKDIKQIRRNIGYMPGRFSLYQDLTVRENLEFFASVFNTTIDENYKLIAPIYSQLERFNNRLSGKLSGGMKQKLALCCALIHAPRVLFLDEPTTGVDPVSRKEFWEMLHNLREEYGITMLVSTPYMDEAMRCDRIALISQGHILDVDTPQHLIDRYVPEITDAERDEFVIKAVYPLEDVFIHLMRKQP